jgi:serine/threonine protein kinase/Tol biopolymer transport system component
MGEVYRARDTRLGREVALKVVSEETSGDPDLVQRLEREARAASSLNHPNLVVVHDAGEASLPGRAAPVPYIVMELLVGEPLSALIADGPLKLRQFLDLAAELAEGLAAAHEAGLVHRDLKPSNIIVSPEGHAKILDFGLAKVAAHRAGESMAPTGDLTLPGEVVGTVAYMSPEQARGEPAAVASDQFSLGCVFYQMLTGHRPFQRPSNAETLSAILRDDPPPIEDTNPAVPAPVCWIVERCLAKSARARYASTRDLAVELANLREHSRDLSSSVFRASRSRRVRGIPRLRAAVALAGAFAGLVGIGLLVRRPAPPEPPYFHRLTWQRGTVFSARFAPDGQTLLYSASWDGKPPATFLKRPESPDAVPLDLPSAKLLAISPSGEVAIQLDPQYAHFDVTRGTLARVPLTGGTPREIAVNINHADWGPGGSLVVARDMAGKGRLESPVGKVLYETAGHVSFPRFSPKGDLIAFVDHPLAVDDRGSIAVIALDGHKKTLSKEFESVQGLAWSSTGREVWFTAAEAGTSRSLLGVTLEGAQRAIARVPGDARLQDVAASGRVLLTRGDPRYAIRWLPSGEKRERELSWFGWSSPADLSPDGKTIIFMEAGEPAGPNYAVCLCRMDGSPVRLGEGNAGALSPDGKWVISRLPKAGAGVILLPTGAGEPREIGTRGLSVRLGGPWSSAWLPDGKRILLVGREEGRGLNRLFVQDLDGNTHRPISPEGVGGYLAISPDGTLVAAPGPDGKIALYPVDGGEARAVPGAAEEDLPQQWSADGRSLYVRQHSGLHSDPERLFRLDVRTGARVLFRELLPEDPAGVVGTDQVRVTPDGRSYAYNYYRLLSDLYLVEGLK